MRDESRKLLVEIRELPLFSHLGEPCTMDVRQVRSWSEALRSCATIKWESVTLMANNRSAGRMHELDWHRAQTWNPTCEMVRPQVDAIADEALRRVATTRRVTDAFRNCVRWDLQAMVLEMEFADVLPPVFHYPRLFPIYCAGHFPCGWTGPRLDTYWSSSRKPMPHGQILVY
jgi:hypothetical protein